jgi:hypothetical protein
VSFLDKRAPVRKPFDFNPLALLVHASLLAPRKSDLVHSRVGEVALSAPNSGDFWVFSARTNGNYGGCGGREEDERRIGIG